MDIFKVPSWKLFNKTRSKLGLRKSDINEIEGARGVKIIFCQFSLFPQSLLLFPRTVSTLCPVVVKFAVQLAPAKNYKTLRYDPFQKKKYGL